jgi:uncharacterized protein (DUF433 family)
MSGTNGPWRYLAPNPKSAYKQLFIKGTRIRAEIIYGMTVDGSEPMTPEQVAEDRNLPLEAVREAVAYCSADPPGVREDHRREEARMDADSLDGPSRRVWSRRPTPQEIAYFFTQL